VIICVCPNPSVDTLVTVKDLSPGQVHRASREKRYPGGKGIHVALAAAELGGEVTLMGFWAGPTGSWIRRQCERFGVGCAGPRIPGWSRSCITFKSSGPYDETELLGVGPRVSSTHIEELERCVEELAPSATAVTLSGSWPPGAPPDSYARLIGILNAHEKPVMLDCTGEALELALPMHPDTLHLNRQEAEAATGVSDPMQAAQRLAESCRVAAVTSGAEGAWFCSGGQMLHAVCRIEPLYSGVGSGDCFLAGLAFAQVAGMSLREAAILGTACGAANRLRPALGMLRRDVVLKLSNAVRIREIR
jgi:tagatose 6-phosphate kinase